jgi:hypothetical protein
MSNCSTGMKKASNMIIRNGEQARVKKGIDRLKGIKITIHMQHAASIGIEYRT